MFKMAFILRQTGLRDFDHNELDRDLVSKNLSATFLWDRSKRKVDIDDTFSPYPFLPSNLTTLTYLTLCFFNTEYLNLFKAILSYRIKEVLPISFL